MTSDKFSEIEDAWYKSQHNVLGVKAGDYATEDRLYNFKAIAQLTGLTPLQACMVLRAKHTVALYEKVFKGEPISPGFFDEKAGDDANYLVLAKALYTEQEFDSQESQKPRNLSEAVIEELVKNAEFYAKMDNDAEKEAFLATRIQSVINDVFPSTKIKKSKPNTPVTNGYYSSAKDNTFSEDFIEMLIDKWYEEKDMILQDNPLFVTELEEKQRILDHKLYCWENQMEDDEDETKRTKN